MNFVDLLEKCENDYLTHNRLTFNKNNHLVATKGRRRIRRACQWVHYFTVSLHSPKQQAGLPMALKTGGIYSLNGRRFTGMGMSIVNLRRSD